MSSARCLILFAVLELVLLCGGTGERTCAAEGTSQPASPTSLQAAPDATEVVPQAAGQTETHRRMTPAQKKSYLGKWARASLLIVLIAVIFVVVLMVVSRRMRLWVLGRDRPVTFGPVEDLWWQKDKPESPDRKKKSGEK